MERKKTATKTKSETRSASKTAHSEPTHSRTRHSAHRAPAAKTIDRTYTVISNEPEDMAVLSGTQQAEIFDMSASESPLSDSQVVREARVQAALEPVGTDAAIEPIVTEDGVITPNSR